MRNMEFQGRKVGYDVQGRGPAVVLLHGFCEDSSVWDDFKTDLIEEHYRVICIDLPGFGQSEALPHPTIEAYADAVHAVVESLDLQQIILIGHSMGGYTALAFAEKHPSLLLGLGMFHSSPYADSAEKKEARRRSIQFVEEQGHVIFVKQLLPVLFSENFARSNSYAVDRLVHAASSYPAAGIIGGLEAMIQRPDRTSILSEAAYPVLFIIGEEDRAIPAEQSLSQTHLPAVASVHVLEKVGHMGMIEAQKKTQRIVREFAGFCLSQSKNR
ncbi:MAG: alpha/beta hydrolase [Saprospiraceae bacterium]|nr:alpha/beta hydrolase [Saprospiraceae bacterium]